ncbi:MAG: hypothetical protein WEE03_05965 [Chloroflexota bacterium]
MDDVTRPVYQGLSEEVIAGFYVLIFITLGTFFFGLWLRVRKFRAGHGRYPLPLRSLPRRLWSAFWAVAKHTTIGRDDLYVRLAHFLTFWGFAALFVATVVLTIDYDLVRRVFPPGFWRGPFFLAYELFADTGGVFLVAGVLMMMVRRWIVRPFRLGYARVDLPPERYSRADYARGDAVFLFTLLGLALTGFLLEGARIAADPSPFVTTAFVGNLVAGLLAGAGLSPATAEIVRAYSWWLHALASMTFVALLPFGKGVHMFLDIATLVLRDPVAGRRLPAPEAAR